MEKKERPLSPHLGIYKPQLTSVTSILHRITGVGLAFGTGIFIWFLIALGWSENCFDCFHYFITSFAGRLVIFFWMLGMAYHLVNGIRHLIWDMGYGFKIEDANKSAIVVFIISIIVAVSSVCVAY